MQAQGLTLVAFDEAQPLGFKSGYALPEEGVFYSWLGGVLPACRRQGIGQLLLDAQHDWCRQQGFRAIRTKTLNRWKSMLLLNLRNGFDITGTYAGENGVLKILLEKQLV